MIVFRLNWIGFLIMKWIVTKSPAAVADGVADGFVSPVEIQAAIKELQELRALADYQPKKGFEGAVVERLVDWFVLPGLDKEIYLLHGLLGGLRERKIIVGVASDGGVGFVVTQDPNMRRSGGREDNTQQL
jgi:hypothetical protein